MPKALLDLKSFEGGMNDHSSPRDLEENELSLAQNVVISHKGIITSAFRNTTNSGLGSISYDPPDGTALYSIRTDFNHLNEEVSTEHLLSSNGRYLKRKEGGWETIIDLGNTYATGDNNKIGLVVYDGAIRFCDGSLQLNSTTKQPSTETRIYNQFTRNYFNGATSVLELNSTTSASIIKPDYGRIGFGLFRYSNVDVTTTDLTGYLGLEVKKSNYKVIEDALESNWSSSSGMTYTTATATTNKAFKLSSMNLNNPSDTFIDQHGTTHTASSMTNASVASVDGSPIHLKVELDNINDYLYVYYTIDPDKLLREYGATAATTNTTYQQYLEATYERYDGSSWSSATVGALTSSAPAWATGPTLEFTLEAKDHTGTFISITSTVINAGSPDEREFVNYPYQEYRLKIKKLLNESGTDKVRIKVYPNSTYLTAHLRSSHQDTFRTLQTSQDNTSVNISKNAAYSSNDLNDSNALHIKLAIPDTPSVSAGPDSLDSINFIFCDDTNFNNNSNKLKYTLNNVWVKKNAGKGWITVLIPFKDLIVDTGTPTLKDCVNGRIELNTTNIGATALLVMFDELKIIEYDIGTWDGNYKFFYSWIYDRDQESSFFEFPFQGYGYEFVTNKATVAPFIKQLSSGGFSNGGKRITGANVYFAEFDSDTGVLKYNDPFYLMSVDLERGVSDASGDVLKIWDTSGSQETVSSIEYSDPPFLSNFSLKSGYVYDKAEHIEKIRFRDAVVMNRRIYYGNVDVVFEQQEGETNPLRIKYSDRVYKSLANKPDIVTKYSYIDILTNDGDEITALETYADRLLVYKSNTMYLVNATKDVEFLEDTYEHKGVWSKSAVARVDSGVVWVNQNGAYYYNGDKVINLTDKKLSQSTWATNIGSKPSVIYEPKEKHILVMSTGTDDGFICDLDVGAWTMLTDFKDSDTTNAVLYNDGIVYAVTGSSAITFKNLLSDKNPSSTQKIQIFTRDIDFGSSGKMIDLKKVYVTYKGNATNIIGKFRWRKNGQSTPNNSFTAITDFADASDVSQAIFKPTSKVDAKGIHSLQLLFNTDESQLIHMDFELHDVSIVYRERKVK